MEKLVKKILAKFNLELKRKSLTKSKGFKASPFTMTEALKRCEKRGLKVNTVIDVGASDGRWSQLCNQILPNTDFLLVEAQAEHQQLLDSFCEKFPNSSYVIAAAGPSDGKIYFDDEDLFGGVGSLEPIRKNAIEIDAISIDNEIKRRGLKGPFLLKLDTHGFEVPILEGAKEVLQAAELVIIETYNYQLTNDSLKYFEMCNYMKELGFSPIEMVDFMLRKYDHTFWQMDTFFIKSTHECFNYRLYK